MNLFAHPIILIYFIPVALLMVLFCWTSSKIKQNAICKLFQKGSYEKLTQALGKKSPYKILFLFIAVFFLFTTLAQPQWGREIVEVKGSFAQTVIAVDVSASMNARDLSPDRLENAKIMLKMLATHLKQERIGIIAFTSQAYVQCPITTDTDALNYFISSLKPDMLPIPGTALEAPIKLAAKMLSKYPGKKALILLTDGEDHLPEQLASAKETAIKYGIKLITVGIGTKEGTLIPAKVDTNGQIIEYKKDKRGNTVVSKLDEKSLIDLAKATDGLYVSYTTPAQVAYKIEEAIKGLDKTTSTSSRSTIYKNRYRISLTLALVFLFLFLIFPERIKKSSKKVK